MKGGLLLFLQTGFGFAILHHWTADVGSSILYNYLKQALKARWLCGNSTHVLFLIGADLEEAMDRLNWSS